MHEKSENRKCLDETQEDLFKALRIRSEMMSDEEIFKLNERISEIVTDVITYDVALVECKFCYEPVSSEEAHIHQGEFVGECCWDERLRITG